MKELSIIVPVYNTEKYIRRCLDSVLVPQALPYIEVIAVNDGSSDSSLAILKEYKEKFSESFVLIDKENGGHGSAINAGLKIASGKYLRILDSDDWFDTPRFLAFLKKLAECDEDLIVTPYTQEYTASGAMYEYSYDFLEDDTVYRAEELEFDTDKTYFTLASSTYKVSLLRECGLTLFEKTFYVDMQYNIYPIPFLHTIRFLDINIYRYFIGRPAQSMSQESLQRHLPNHEKVLKFLVDYYAAFCSKVDENRRRYMGLMIYFMYYTFIDLVCMKMKDRSRAYHTFRSFDLYLKKTAPDLYDWVNDFPYLRATRHLGYLNIRFGTKALVTLLNFLRRFKKH